MNTISHETTALDFALGVEAEAEEELASAIEAHKQAMRRLADAQLAAHNARVRREVIQDSTNPELAAINGDFSDCTFGRSRTDR